MTGYIKTTIDFDSLQKDLDAAKALDEASRQDAAKKVLKSMSEKLEKGVEVMPRLISFAMTTDQFRDKTKTVTRRWGWLHAKPGMILTGVEKAMGLQKGEEVVRLGDIRVLSVRREPFNRMVEDMDYGRKELQLEGHPFGLTDPVEFVEKLCKGTKNKPSDLITRIEYEYL